MSELGERLEALIREIVRDELKAQPATLAAPDPRTISESEFCERVGISTRTARRLRIRGKLPHTQIGRRVFYTPEQVEEFLKAHKRAAPDSATEIDDEPTARHYSGPPTVTGDGPSPL